MLKGELTQCTCTIQNGMGLKSNGRQLRTRKQGPKQWIVAITMEFGPRRLGKDGG
jgi:hypothetical protein